MLLGVEMCYNVLQISFFVKLSVVDGVRLQMFGNIGKVTSPINNRAVTCE